MAGAWVAVSATIAALVAATFIPGRTRIIPLSSGELLVNVIPPSVNLEKIVYRQEKKSVRVTDGSQWYLDISDLAWR